MKERRLAREIAMQLLFQWEMQGLLMRKSEIEPDFITHLDLRSFLGHFLHNFYMKDKTALDLSFIDDLVKGVLKHLVDIDNVLDKISQKWKLSRMDAIDRAILRIACYELMVKKTLSKRVIINEAIEIAKRFGSEQSPSFVNGILDNLNTDLQ